MSKIMDDAQKDVIEMENLLETDSLPTVRHEYEEVEYNGEILKLYPLDYQKAPIVRYQIAACLLMFIVFGMNDQSNGSLLPTLMSHYNVSRMKVANLFLMQVSGYTLASLMTEKVHTLIGTRGAMALASFLCVIFFSILSLKPPNFLSYLLCFLPLGLSIGILDSTGNVLFGNLEINKNEWMGILHGLYGAAAMITPPAVSYFVTYGNWSSFFLLPLACSILGLLLMLYAFRYETANKYNYICFVAREGKDDEQQPGFLKLLRKPAIMMYALYLFMYLGSEVSTGSWMFTYLLEVKHGEMVPMSYVTSSFWIGLTVGRLVLGFVTKRFFKNEYRASVFYGNLTWFFYTLFLLIGLVQKNSVPYFFVLSVSIFFAGVFIGPLFPNASVVALQILPRNLHVSGVGMAVALGGCGAAVMPYATGLVTHLIGLSWFPFLCWIMVTIVNAIWLTYPKFVGGQEEYL